MDFVKKIICLEDARTRTQGLMPYFEFGKDYSVQETSSCDTVSNLSLEIASGVNGNWGQFVANPCFLASCGKTYNTMLHNYYEILNMVRNGVKLRKVSTKEGEVIFTEDVGAFYYKGTCFSGGTEPDYLYDYAAYDAKYFYSNEIDSLRDETKNIYQSNTAVNDQYIVLIEDYDKFQGLCNYLSGVNYSSVSSESLNVGEHEKWAQYCKIVDACIGIINIPARIYNKHLKVPKTMAMADINSYIEWLTSAGTDDCCTSKLWEERGGQEMLDFLNGKKGLYESTLRKLSGLDYAKPYIDVPLLIIQNFTDVGTLTNIDGVDYVDNEDRPHHDATMPTGFTIDDIHMGQERKTYPVSGDGAIEVESLLETLRSRKKYSDDEDNLLPGLFQKYNGKPEGKLFVCLKAADKKYYELVVSAHTVVSGEIIDWCVKYQETGITDNDIVGMGNFRESLNLIYAGHITQQEANDILFAEEAKYSAHDETNVYRVRVAEAEWTMSALTGDKTAGINGDGMESAAVKYDPDDDFRVITGKYFRTITTESAGIRIAETEEDEAIMRGDANTKDPLDTHYFFVVKYDNSPIKPMTIPYEVGNTANVYAVDSGNPNNTLYRGDFITRVVTGSDFVEVEYVIGGYFNGTTKGKYNSYAGSGDVYYEKRTLDPDHVDYVALDGVDKVPVWSEYVDSSSGAKEFYSPRYNLYRTGNTANIIEMTTGEFWNEDWAYDAYLAKEDYLINFSNPPKIDVNVTVDRGGASAFERHYKLSECNTMQDLEQYSNGEFFNTDY